MNCTERGRAASTGEQEGTREPDDDEEEGETERGEKWEEGATGVERSDRQTVGLESTMGDSETRPVVTQTAPERRWRSGAAIITIEAKQGHVLDM